MSNVELKRIDPVFNPDYIYLKNAKITREYFDYYLHDLSSKDAKDKFVEFCKQLINVEICENLEVYDEDDGKSTAGPLYVGEGINGSKIAFRINTKSNWMKHYEHDMKKYSEEDNNLFSEFYFITYQDIIPKVLFNNETKYLSINKIKVHLFDRKWLIDKIFEHEIYMNIALDVFELSKNLNYDEAIVSYKNQQNPLGEIEKMFDDFLNLSDNNSDDTTNKQNISISYDELKNQYDLAISIIDKTYNHFNDEETLNEMMYTFASKYKKILEIKGNDEELIKFAFDSAVRYFFCDENISRYIDCFETLCSFLEKKLTPDLYEMNIILWTMLRKLDATPEDRGGFLSRINACHELMAEKKTNEEDEIKVIHANTFLSMYTKDEKSKRMDSYSKILMRTYGYHSIRLYYFAILFMEDRYYFSDNHDLVDLCVENFIKVLKDHNISSLEIGKIHLKQALDATKANDINDMIYYNEALKLFEAADDGMYLTAKTLYELGKIFDRKKMHWLSRCMYVYGLTECIKLYEQQGVTSKIFLELASELKMVELSLGRIMYSTRFYCLEQIIREINNDNVGKSQDTYDFALAVLVYKTPLIKLEQIGKLSRYFEKYGLYYSNIAVKHELGHYDKKLLNALDNNKKTFDEYVAKWKQQPVGSNNENIEPWYGVEYKSHLNLDFMGCRIKLDVENKAITLEYASMLYASLQSILCCADSTEVQVEKITIYVLYDKESMFNVNVTHSKIYDRQFIVKIGRFDKDNIDSQQQILKAHIIEFINNIMNSIFRYKISYNKIKTAVEDISCVQRNESIASSFVNALDVFGFTTFNYNLLTSGYDNILSNRSIDDVFPNQNLAQRILELKRRLRATFENTELVKEKIKHNVINVKAWDDAIWDTVDIPNKAGSLPIIAFVFKNQEKGKDIFDTWIEKYSEDDKNNYIGIRILKKIDVAEPFKYRVVVGNTRKMYNDEDGSEIETPVYTCTISAENVAKLYTFERLMKTNTHYLICPAFYNEDGDIIYDWNRIIKKRCSSIKCCNVWEIDMNDLLFTEGVFSTDKPVVPHGEDSIALISLIEEKKIRVQVLNAALNMTEE